MFGYRVGFSGTADLMALFSIRINSGWRRHLGKFWMAVSPQRLTIYLYSAHRAVIFAIAQLSCSKIIFLLVQTGWIAFGYVLLRMKHVFDILLPCLICPISRRHKKPNYWSLHCSKYIVYTTQWKYTYDSGFIKWLWAHIFVTIQFTSH